MSKSKEGIDSLVEQLRNRGMLRLAEEVQMESDQGSTTVSADFAKFLIGTFLPKFYLTSDLTAEELARRHQCVAEQDALDRLDDRFLVLVSLDLLDPSIQT